MSSDKNSFKVFFTASFYGKSEYQAQYDLVRSAIKQTGVHLISPEEGNYQDVLSTQQRKRFGDDPNHLHYQAVKKGIQASDAVIIDISYQDFQLGWEAALAVQNKKPLLCLSVNEDFSPKILHPHFHAAQYSEVTIDNLLENFLQRAQSNVFTERFNFFLSPTQLNHVRDEAKRLDLNTSQFIRKLIDHSRNHH
jgi:nucleoside 2-deoxyribosyltransferase